MSVTIEVNSTDRTEAIEYKSFHLQRVKTSQVDTFQFQVIRKNATGWKPENLDDVLVYENSTVIFGGQVIEVTSEVDGKDMEILTVMCKDYSFEMDRFLVANTYEDETVDAIIEDIKDNFMPSGFTTTHVDAPVTISYIAFNYEYPSKCLQQLAELINYDWYVDENKNIYFFAKDTQLSPFDLTDTNGKYYFNSLKTKKDIKSMRNTIVVRGGTYLGDSTTEEIEADGEQITFNWAYKYSNAVWKIDGGSALNVGIDFIDDPTSYDALYNFNEKALKFPDGSKPTAGQVVSVTGNPHIPVIIKLEDPTAVATYGTFEYKIIDTSINTKEGARARAQAEILSWSDELDEGYFETKEVGLKVGQKINVQSTIRGIDEDFYISKIITKLTNGNEMLHLVTLVTTQTFGIIEFLQRQLIQKDKEIVINENEVIDIVKTYSESISIAESFASAIAEELAEETIVVSESFTPQALDYPVEFCAGAMTPTGYKRVFITNGSRLG